LLGRGQELLEHYFRGIVEELLDAGAVPIEVPQDVLALSKYGWGPREGDALHALSASRELLDFHVRHRLGTSSSVTFVENTEVTGLIADGSRITAIRIRRRPARTAHADDLDEADAPTMAASFVVDASGRDSNTPRELVALGFQAPRETEIISRAGYSSRYYAIPRGFRADWKLLFFFPGSDLPRGGVLFPVDGDRWLVTLIGVGGDYPPTDPAGFLEFARALRSPLIHNVIKDAEPLSPIHGYRRTENHLRRYELVKPWPERFAVLGDAACAFNPIYGQGITVCALQAHELDKCLAEARTGGMAGIGIRVQQRVAGTTAFPWRVATSADLEYPTTQGTRPRGLAAVVRLYLDRLQRVSQRDPVVASAFRRVTQLLAPPAALFAPGVAARVLAPRKIEPRTRPPTKTAFGA
jgi:2-polyprenyl-6-methoxyphenol hydroxylase-like FAD-dependent oxidoreductase